ncbi:MAG TPA: phospho-N-acetylmuramoyl-pentapeptide-transferase [Bacillota bacterium]|nr:phospho-N-acetylmuramoyl-pentapeptide-transferase [Bacillota bacterium]
MMLVKFAAAFAVSAAATFFLIPELRKFKAGQTIREDGPQGHLAKAGTPTMGGIAMIFAVAVVVAIFEFKSSEAWIMLGVIVVFGAIGFCDDFIKVVKHNNLGLRAWQKLGLQTLVAFVIAWYRSLSSTDLILPFAKTSVTLSQGWYIAFIVFMVLAMTNSVNLSDGLDGLCCGVTGTAALAFAVICAGIGAAASSGLMAAVAGACGGFLIFNVHPAKVFMGDTGSIALGGALAAAAIFSDLSLLLPIIGIVYVAEALSVIIQVAVFQTCNGKRFFRMSPLHHHFELGGWSENKVVAVFVSVTAAVSLAAIAAFRFF